MDSITRVPGSLKKTLAVAEELIPYGIPVYFKCPIMYHNATRYFTIVEIAKQYGAKPQIDITLTDAVDGDNAISEQLQVDGELLEIILRDDNFALYVGKEVPEFGKVQRDRNAAFCGAGTVLMNITPEGDVTPCNSFPTQFGNLKEKSFTEIWIESQSLKVWQHTFIKDYEECGSHERCEYCNRFPGQSFTEHGTPLKASTANCYSANARLQLAKKLRNGYDPLEGKTVAEKLQEFHLDKVNVVSRKENPNYRNFELNIKK